MQFDFHELLANAAAAAWAQAIGSFIALGIAIYVPNSQAKRVRSEKREAILAVADAAYWHVCNIRREIDGPDFAQGRLSAGIFDIYNKVVIDSLVKALQAVPMHEIGSSQGVIAMLSLTEQIVFVGAAIQSLIDGPTRQTGYIEGVKCYEPTDHVQCQGLYDAVFGVLVANARMHLDKIDSDYASLFKSVKPAGRVSRWMVWLKPSKLLAKIKVG